MDTETLLKLFGAACAFVVAFIGFLKYYLDLSVNQKNKHRDDYRFAKEFYADIASMKPMQPYLIEKGYLAVSGNSNLQQNEVEYLLTLTGAATALRQYSLGKRYLKDLPTSGSLKIGFKKMYSNSYFRNLVKLFYFVFYFIFFTIASLPLILILISPKNYVSILSSTFALPFVFIPIALYSAFTGARMLHAEKLVKNQKTHIEQIILAK